MTQVSQQELQRNLNRSLDDLMDELALYDPTTRSPGDVWQKLRDPIHQRLCVEWGYCTVRADARWADDLGLAVAVAGILTERVLNLPFPVDMALISTIVVKRGLDLFCGCP